METSSTRIQPGAPSERTLAALAHASAIVPIASLLAPILIWATRRDRSPYAAFQALQAAIVQGVMAAITTAGLALYALSFFLIFAVPPRAGEKLVIASTVLIFAVLAIDLGLALYSLAGAIMAFQGRDFRYLWVASLVDSMGSKKTRSR